MSVKDLQLTGQNFCHLDCAEKDSIIHPETCISQVITNDASNQTLEDWLLYNHHENESFETGIKTGLLEWLETYYPIAATGIQPATYTTAMTPNLGGVLIDPTYLTINSSGVLSINTASLDIPSISGATFTNAGIIKLGHNNPFDADFTSVNIPPQTHTSYTYASGGSVYAFPLRLDSNNRAGIAIPTSLFGGSSSPATLPDWTFDWSKFKTTYDLGTIPEGNTMSYVLLGTKNTNSSNGDLGYDGADTSTDYGYPRFALVAGPGVSFTRYTNTFLTSLNNPWGNDITEILISASSSVSNMTIPQSTPSIGSSATTLATFTLNNTDYNITGKVDVFTGPDSLNDDSGTEGLVPAPEVGDETKFLRGDGTWASVGSASADNKYFLSLDPSVTDLTYTQLSNIISFINACFATKKTAYINITFVKKESNPALCSIIKTILQQTFSSSESFCGLVIYIKSLSDSNTFVYFDHNATRGYNYLYKSTTYPTITTLTSTETVGTSNYYVSGDYKIELNYGYVYRFEYSDISTVSNVNNRDILISAFEEHGTA